jgi:hypothetical protein
VQGPGFSKSNHSQQPKLAVPNKVSVQAVSGYNEVGLGHQRPAVANQVQRVESTANHLQPGAVDWRRTPSVAAMVILRSLEQVQKLCGNNTKAVSVQLFSLETAATWHRGPQYHLLHLVTLFRALLS